MPKDFNAEQLAEQDWLKPVTAFAESRKADLPACDPVLAKLIEARKLIELPERWCKIQYDGDNSSHCIHGALNAAHAFGLDVREALIVHLPPQYVLGGDTRSISLMLWNDDRDTTHADVLALFDRAIAARKGA